MGNLKSRMNQNELPAQGRDDVEIFFGFDLRQANIVERSELKIPLVTN